MKAALLHRNARAWLALLVACGALLVPTPPVLSQEQFFTQSGGRGLQNAKTNARLSKAETEIGVMQEDLRTIKPHARAELGACAADGEKLRFDGTNWVCDQETDPTVQAFAKKALPTCTGGSMLGVVGGELGCSQVGFVTQETDPTVQEFAKQPLPQCASEQLIAVGANNTLRCITDQQGITNETDPRVYDFAKRDAVSVLPNCPAGELLTMVNGRLGCRVDQVGISVEVDPQVQDFARKDNGQPALAACANGEVLRATTQGGKVVLACENATGALTETLALNDLSDVITTGQTSGSALTYSNGFWRAMPTLGSAANPLYLNQLGDVQISSAQSDEVLRWDGTRWVNSNDKLGTLTDTNWCRTVGTEIVCDRPPPLTCNSGELLSWDGTSNTWLCTDAATSIGNAIQLNDLGDVSITSVVTGQALRFDGTGWVNSTIERILAGDTQIVATDTGTDGLLSFATDGVTRVAITNEGRVGIGVMPASPYMLDVSGSIRASGDITATNIYGQNGVFGGDLTVRGNLNVSGSQSIDGVIFANGGVALSGTLASGNVSTTYLSATLADIRTLRGNAITYTSATFNTAVVAQATLTNVSVTVADIDTLRATLATLATLNATQANLTNISGTRVDIAQVLRVSGTTYVQDINVLGNLNVSGSQRIDGVLFANGGIALSGTVISGNISATNLSATVADIRTLRVTNNQTVGGGVSVTGNVQANTFIGSGASLTNIPASAVVGLNLDRISTSGVSSGANLAMVVADQGTVSFTLAGNPGRAYLDSTLGLVAPGVSTTGGISATNGYFAGNVGIGNVPSSTIPLLVSSTLGTPVAQFTSNQNIVEFNTAGNSLDIYSSLNTFSYINRYRNNRQLIIAAGGTGSVGIGTAANVNLSTTLQVSGTLRIANGGEACDANRLGAIRYTGGEFSFCRNGTAWETLSGIVQGSADRITSGTTQLVVVSNTGFISLTQAGTNTAWFDPTRGLVTLGVSTTGPVSATSGYFTRASFDGVLTVEASGSNRNLILRNLTNNREIWFTAEASGGSIDMSSTAFHIGRSNPVPLLLNPSSTARVGINTPVNANPSVSLQISGTMMVSNGGESCNTALNGAIRFTGGDFSVCRNGSAWETLTSIAQGAAGLADRISSGTTQLVVVSNTGFISLTQAGTNTAWFDPTRGLVTLGVSTTGPISGTTGYFGNLGVGINAGGGYSIWAAQGIRSEGRYQSAGGSALSPAYGFFIQNTTGMFLPSTGSLAFSVSGSEVMRVVSTSRVGIATTNPATALDISGTMRVADGGEACDANRVGAIRYLGGDFSVCRNGSAWETLTSIAQGAAGLADRISSGTTQLVVVSNTGFVSLTQAGTNTGWFDPTRGLVTLGVSATGGISGTTGYFGNLAVGGTAQAGFVTTVNGNLYISGLMRTGNGTASSPAIRFGTDANTGFFQPLSGAVAITASSTEVLRVVSTGMVGVMTTNPQTALHISGTLRISNAGEACDTNRLGAIRYTASDFSVCRNGSSWETLTSIAQGAAGLADRISSGTTQLVVVSNTGFVSLTQAGTNTGWFDPTRGLVTLGVSATGGISGTTGYFAGNVGIGMTSPAYRLDVSGSIRATNQIRANQFVCTVAGTCYITAEQTGGQFVFQVNGGTDALLINSAGNIRMGAGTANVSLSIAAGEIQTASSGVACAPGTAGAIRYTGGNLSYCNGSAWTTLAGASSATPGGVSGSIQFNSGGAFAGRSDLTVNTTGVIATAAQIEVGANASGNRFAYIDFVGDDTYTDYGLRIIRQNGGPNTESDIVHRGTGEFSVATLESAPFVVKTSSTERMRVSAAGFVGISTSNPLERLDVRGNQYLYHVGTNTYLNINADASNWSFLRLSSGSAAQWDIAQNSGIYSSGLQFRAGGSNPNVVFEKANPALPTLFVGAANNIGVGTITPAASLSIAAGEVQVASSGAACVAGMAGAIRYTGGNLSYCNGSAWTDLAAAAGINTDRITSGTTSVVAQNNSAVSITIAGSNVANFGSGGLGITNINASGAVTATGTGYFGGNVGLGVLTPSNTLHISGTMRIDAPGGSSSALDINAPNSSTSATIRLGTTAGKNLIFNTRNGNVTIDAGLSGGANLSMRLTNSPTLAWLSLQPTGNIGIGGFPLSGATAQTALHVSGTLMVANGGEACDASRIGAIRFTGGDFSVCRNGSAWETFTSIASGAAAAADRITSGTTQLVVVSDTGFVSLTQAGTNTGWFDPTRGLVTLGVSSTGTISGTVGYFSGAVGIGMAPSNTQALSVNTSATSSGLAIHFQGSASPVYYLGAGSSGAGTLRLAAATNTFAINNSANQAFVRFLGSNSAMLVGTGVTTASQTLHVNGSALITSWTAMNFGTGTRVTATAPLEVSGTISATTLKTGPGESCASSADAGAIRYSGGALSFCNGSAWTTLGSAGSADWYGITNIPTQVQNVSNGTTLSMSLVSASNISGTLAQITRVSSTNISATNISTTRLTVNGVDITGSGNADRIISGTSNAIVNSATGVISFTQLGVASAYLHPTLGLVAPGVSTTGPISATSVYAGTAIQLASPTVVTACNASSAGTLRYNSPTTTIELCTGSGWQPMGVGIPAGTISAFASTTCPVGWSEYTPARGRFLRGIDNGAGNDPAGTRAPGNVQGDAYQAHTHNFAGGSNAIGTGTVAPGGQSGNAFTFDMSSAMTGGSGNASTETRPKNVAVTYCQFNGTSNGWNNPLSGGGATPGGSTGAVQYNTSGSFDGSGNFTWTNASSLLSITGTLSATNVYGLNISGTNGFFPNLSAGAIAANSLSSTLVSASNISGTLAQITRVSSTNISATNISTTRLTVNGVDITGSGGATRLASLTDVSLSNLTGLDILRYNGTSWTNVNVQNAISTTTMTAGWPDAIRCVFSNGISAILYQAASPYNDGRYNYRFLYGGGIIEFSYNPDGSYYAAGSTGTSGDCTTTSFDTMGELYAAGRAFNFIGGSGTVTPTVDRITSGTSNAIVNSATGVISFTQLGVATAYLHPSLGLVAPGVSTTGGISGTTGYFAAPNTVNALILQSGSGSLSYGAFGGTGFLQSNNDLYVGTMATGTSLILRASSSEVMRLTNGNVGIGATSPATRLDVSGTIRIANGGEACNGTTAGAIRYSGGALSFCNGTAWTTLGSAGAADWYGLTNIPTQVQNVSNGTVISMTQVSATNVSASALQLGGTGTCSAATAGMMRYTDIGGGVMKLQLCRP